MQRAFRRNACSSLQHAAAAAQRQSLWLGLSGSSAALRRVQPLVARSSWATKQRLTTSAAATPSAATEHKAASPASAPRRIRMTDVLISGTQKEDPAAADIPSHQLMLRAGLIRPVPEGHGLYMYMPLMMRSLRKLETIIDEELAAIGCMKLDMPLVTPSNLWKQSGRWDTAGPELLRIKDRRGSSLCLSPTHEEVFTALVAKEVVGPKQLPLRLYQVGKKFRDEIRPRFGLLRAREFIMKDLYSFDATQAKAMETYDEVSLAYRRIFDRVGVKYVTVEADTGNIGGNQSHEFHIPCSAGEDTLLVCSGAGSGSGSGSHSACSYAANVEKAFARAPEPLNAAQQAEWRAKEKAGKESDFAGDPRFLSGISAEDRKIASDVIEMLMPKGTVPGLPIKCNVVLMEKTKTPIVVFLRADNELNPLSVKAHVGGQDVQLLSAREALSVLKTVDQPGLRRLLNELFEEERLAQAEQAKEDAEADADEAKAAARVPAAVREEAAKSEEQRAFEREQRARGDMEASLAHAERLMQHKAGAGATDAGAALGSKDLWTAVEAAARERERKRDQETRARLQEEGEEDESSSASDAEDAVRSGSSVSDGEGESSAAGGAAGDKKAQITEVLALVDDALMVETLPAELELRLRGTAERATELDRDEREEIKRRLAAGETVPENMSGQMKSLATAMAQIIREYKQQKGEYRVLGGSEHKAAADEGKTPEQLSTEARLWEEATGTFRVAKEGDLCKDCLSPLKSLKGIEVGHVFYLGKKYSRAFDAKVTPEGKTKKRSIEMGCYGIGVSRVLAAVIEASHDSQGIVWPESVAPYKLCILPIGTKASPNYASAAQLYDRLQQAVPQLKGDIVLDDRPVSPGTRFNDATLLGFPWLVVLGKSFEKEGKLELQRRGSAEKQMLTVDELVAKFSKS